MTLYYLIPLAVLAGFSAGFVIGRFGEISRPKALTWDERKYMAANLAGTNKLEIR
jgi:hypothetical protein